MFGGLLVDIHAVSGFIHNAQRLQQTVGARRSDTQ